MGTSAITESLAQFCIAQSDKFNPDDWDVQFAMNRKALALAAKYLSMTSWYGHEVELELIVAATQVVGESSLGLYRESQVIGFDLPYFSYTVRAGIAQARIRREEAGVQGSRHVSILGLLAGAGADPDVSQGMPSAEA
jgi:hypothetical protein